MQGIASSQSTNDSRPTTSTCQISPVSELKTKQSSGFQQLPSPFTIPIILKGKQNSEYVSTGEYGNRLSLQIIFLSTFTLKKEHRCFATSWFPPCDWHTWYLIKGIWLAWVYLPFPVCHSDPSVMTTSADSQKADSILTSRKTDHRGKWNKNQRYLLWNINRKSEFLYSI